MEDLRLDRLLYTVMSPPATLKEGATPHKHKGDRHACSQPSFPV